MGIHTRVQFHGVHCTGSGGYDQDDDKDGQNDADDHEDEAHAIARGALMALGVPQLRVGLLRVLRSARYVLLYVVHHLPLIMHQHRQVLRTHAAMRPRSYVGTLQHACVCVQVCVCM